jgi:hypothetical protein
MSIAAIQKQMQRFETKHKAGAAGAGLAGARPHSRSRSRSRSQSLPPGDETPPASLPAVRTGAKQHLRPDMHGAYWVSQSQGGRKDDGDDQGQEEAQVLAPPSTIIATAGGASKGAKGGKGTPAIGGKGGGAAAGGFQQRQPKQPKRDDEQQPMRAEQPKRARQAEHTEAPKRIKQQPQEVVDARKTRCADKANKSSAAATGAAAARAAAAKAAAAVRAAAVAAAAVAAAAVAAAAAHNKEDTDMSEEESDMSKEGTDEAGVGAGMEMDAEDSDDLLDDDDEDAEDVSPPDGVSPTRDSAARVKRPAGATSGGGEKAVKDLDGEGFDSGLSLPFSMSPKTVTAHTLEAAAPICTSVLSYVPARRVMDDRARSGAPHPGPLSSPPGLGVFQLNVNGVRVMSPALVRPSCAGLMKMMHQLKQEKTDEAEAKIAAVVQELRVETERSVKGLTGEMEEAQAKHDQAAP